MKKDRMRSGCSSELQEVGLAAAAPAIPNGEVSSETDVGKLLERAREHAVLKAFITIVRIDQMVKKSIIRCLDCRRSFQPRLVSRRAFRA